MGRTTIGERVWDVSRLIDVIETEFSSKVNTEKICCIGNFGGETTTAYAATLDDRITLAMSSPLSSTDHPSIATPETKKLFPSKNRSYFI